MVTKDPDYTFDDAVHRALAYIGPAFQHSVGLDGALPKSLEVVATRERDPERTIAELQEKIAVSAAAAAADPILKMLLAARAQAKDTSKIDGVIADLDRLVDAKDTNAIRALLSVASEAVQSAAADSNSMGERTQEARWNELWGKADAAWKDAGEYIDPKDKEKMEELDKQLKAAIARGDTAEVERLQKEKAKLMVDMGQKISKEAESEPDPEKRAEKMAVGKNLTAEGQAAADRIAKENKVQEEKSPVKSDEEWGAETETTPEQPKYPYASPDVSAPTLASPVTPAKSSDSSEKASGIGA